jgi:hypothetical protein
MKASTLVEASRIELSFMPAINYAIVNDIQVLPAN